MLTVYFKDAVRQSHERVEWKNDQCGLAPSWLRQLAVTYSDAAGPRLRGIVMDERNAPALQGPGEALICIALAGLGWRLYLVFPVEHMEAAVFAVLLGFLPYGMALAFVYWGRARGAATVAAAAALLLDVAVSVTALRSASSTAGVAIGARVASYAARP